MLIVKVEMLKFEEMDLDVFKQKVIIYVQEILEKIGQKNKKEVSSKLAMSVKMIFQQDSNTNNFTNKKK